MERYKFVWLINVLIPKSYDGLPLNGLQCCIRFIRILDIEHKVGSIQQCDCCKWIFYAWTNDHPIDNEPEHWWVSGVQFLHTHITYIYKCSHSYAGWFLSIDNTQRAPVWYHFITRPTFVGGYHEKRSFEWYPSDKSRPSDKMISHRRELCIGFIHQP